jgi:hypothetical protein
MNRVWLRSLVGVCWGIPVVYLAYNWFVLGAKDLGCGLELVTLVTSWILFEAACIAGLLAVRWSWLGLAAAAGAILNGFLLVLSVDDFASSL